LGALALLQTIPEVINQLRKKYVISVVHQAGRGKAQPVQLQYAQMNHKLQESKLVEGSEAEQKISRPLAAQSDNTVLEFIDDIPAQFAQADIVICRAGALTVAEVAATESCAIFVPLPIAVDDHQTYNAKALSDSDAAILIGQDKLANNLYSQLDILLSNPQKITEMGRKARALCIQDATLKVISAIVQEGLREKL
jgi:UDP-N-acetylglucosamine--N-acetylmuramyl-(pentapeptide) pyrophosphoryl-undecaprenol N-acetylglucosamine transferase